MSQSAAQSSEPAGPVPSGVMLRVVRGFYEGLEVPVDRDWVVVGRGRSADIVIAEPTMSRSHAAFGYDGAQFFVQDLGSTNGTRVNGSRLEKTSLKRGDEIQLGKLLVQLELPD